MRPFFLQEVENIFLFNVFALVRGLRLPTGVIDKT